MDEPAVVASAAAAATSPTQQQQQQPLLTFQMEIDDQTKRRIDEKLRECDSDSESDSDSSDGPHNVYTPKAVDLPSAQRLAKRLYYLDGFRASDIARHLSKKLVNSK